MHVVGGRAWETRVDASRATAAMSGDEMIARLGSRRARWEIAAMIQTLSIAASVAEHASRDPAPRGRPWRDGELEVLQPRLPRPAQRVPPAPHPPLNRTLRNGETRRLPLEDKVWRIKKDEF